MPTSFTILSITLTLLFILGLIFGSFGSVLLTRLGDGINRKILRSIIFWRSECPNCKRTLKAQHLIPVVSFFLQKWKCAFCSEKIARKYLALELWSWIIFVLSYLFAQKFTSWTPAITIFWIATNWLLYLLVIFDIEKFELHVPVWFILLLLVAIAPIFIWLWLDNYKRVIIASVVFGWFFYLLYFAAKRYVRKRYKNNHEWIWEWDAMLAFVIWAMMPLLFQIHNISLSIINLLEVFIVFLILSSLIGLLLTVFQILAWSRKIKIWNKKAVIMPFIPAMIVAFWILLYFANEILLFAFPTVW